MTPTSDLPQQTPRQRNWAAWLGLLFALMAILSNAGILLGLPGPKFLTWLGVVLTIAAIVCAVIGVMRAFRQSQVYGGKVSSSILGVLSLLICGLVAFGAIHSRDLPAATNAPQVGQKVPLEQLLKLEGRDAVFRAGGITTAKFIPAPKAVLLVFYRGYW
jgi:hypothetical protein